LCFFSTIVTPATGNPTVKPGAFPQKLSWVAYNVTERIAFSTICIYKWKPIALSRKLSASFPAGKLRFANDTALGAVTLSSAN
jgi:hypothetical protein